MTTQQKTVIGGTIIILVCVGLYEARDAARLRNQILTLQQQQARLAEQIQALQQERDHALQRLASAPAKPTPRLPAPPVQPTATASAAPEELRRTNLVSRIQKGVQLTAKQVEPYLRAHGRNAASLLAAYRTTGDPALLEEAMQKYPKDPLVALEAASREGASPEAQRQWLEALKQSAPDNALPHYLLARNYFKAGQTDQAVQELIAAYGKPRVQDYFVDRMSDNEEAYLAAGYPAAEAKALDTEQLILMPDRGDLKQLAYDVVELAKSYQRAGDEGSAQAALQMATQLGRRYQTGGPGQPTIDQFLGIAIETLALNAMNPGSPYGDSGQTVRDRLTQVAQQKAALKELVTQSEPFRQTMADQDWIGYADRLKTFGEEAALRWVLSKYGHN
jgi:hypothetical protein